MISANNNIWEFDEIDLRLSSFISQKLNLLPNISSILANRVDSIEEAENYLNPKLKNLMPNPNHLLDMEKAVDRVFEAIKNKEKIIIFGDYDVDGATSSSLLKKFISCYNDNIDIYIPDRIKEGYGLNNDAIIKLANDKYTLCITVDCGIQSFEPIAQASKLGMNVIVIDHHISSDKLPNAFAVVNPNRLDDDSEYGYLAAVGVTFLFITSLRRKLLNAGYKDYNIVNLLDLVALGTVCDVVPLKDLNRAFVSQGLKILAKRNNIGLKALSDVASIDEHPNSYHLGFVLGPRINAGGRVGTSKLGSDLLCSNNIDEAFDIALRLDKFNIERKEIELMAIEEADAQISNDSKIIFAKGDWHPGIIGIVAARLKEKYNKPCAVISINDGIGKASARSINGFDFGLSIVNASHLLINGGGHAMAAGFTVEESKIDELHEFLINQMNEDVNFQKIIKINSWIDISSVNKGLMNQLKHLEPFGVSNPEPKFALKSLKPYNVRVLKEKHVSCFLKDQTGKSIKAIAFNCFDSETGNILQKEQEIDIVGTLKTNIWQGYESIQFIISDLKIN